MVVLTGARQTGKTSTFLRLFPKHAFVSLDLPAEAEQAEKLTPACQKRQSIIAAPTGWGQPVSWARQHSRTVLCIGSEIVSLYRRCAFLREHGWNVLSSASGHDGIVRFGTELTDAVVLDVNGDGAETAVIAGELKWIRSKVLVIMLVGDGETLAEGALEIADAVILRSDQSGLLKVLDASQSAA